MDDAKDIFCRATQRIFDCWTALNLAVDNNWGGDDSMAKKDLLVKNIIEFCLTAKELNSYDIEDILIDKIDEYFNVNLEDGSEIEIASILVKLHNTCSNNDFSFANDLMLNLNKSANPSVAAQEPSSDEEETPKTSSRGPKTVTDEDGWTTVL